MSVTAYPRPSPPKRHEPEIQEGVDQNGAYFLNLNTRPTDNVKVAEKPKYVLKPHLTERPLKGHEGLEALKKQLEDSSPKRPQRRNNKEKK